jgi:hypothetical protein
MDPRIGLGLSKSLPTRLGASQPVAFGGREEPALLFLHNLIE